MYACMARMTIQLSDELDKKFRLRVLMLKGSKKGVLGETVAEALDLWLEENPEKKDESI